MPHGVKTTTAGQHTRQPRTRALSATVIVAALLATSGCTFNENEEIVAGRGMQSVDIQMSTDGAITEIGSTTVLVGENLSQTSTKSDSYNPRQVLDDVPLRIQTAYRSANGTGSDLAELQGYTGRVEITFSIENLTVAPQQLEYDAAGQSRTQEALVGVPFTLSASTTLPGISPSQIITEDPDGTGAVTDGVLSRAQNGNAVVQWASLLAPPTGIAGTDFTLVADVTNFTLPRFDLTAQPGLTTDPTLSGTIDAAFNASPASQLELERRTIEVITDVNKILSDASTTMFEIRSNLDATSQSLGVRTTEDLKNSTASIATSAQALQEQLGSLQGDIATRLEASNEITLQQLDATVTAVDQILGDTSAPPSNWTPGAEGCSIAPPQQDGGASTIYASVQQLSAALDAYATAADTCREQIRTELQRAIGPAEPNQQNCTEPSSTCALFNASLAINGAFAQFIADGQSIVVSLKPELLDAVTRDFSTMSATIDTIAAEAAGLQQPGSTPAPDEAALTQLRTSLDELLTTMDTTSTSLSTVHSAAQQASAEIGIADGSGSIQSQSAELATKLCALLTPEAAEGAGMTVEQVEALRAYLTEQPCPESGTTGTLPPPPGYIAPLDQRLAQQASAWHEIMNLTDPAGQGIAGELANLKTQLTTARAQLDALQNGTGEQDEAARIARLQKAISALAAQRDTMNGSLTTLEEQQAALGPAITEAFENASSAASESITAIIDEQIRVVAASSTEQLDHVDEIFTGSVQGLQSSAEAIQGQSVQAIEDNRAQATAAAEQARASIPQQTENSLRGIALNIDSSTRDAEAVNATLVADLGKVMIDLGLPAPGAPGILGSMSTSAVKVGSADYQLALATQSANAYANVRAEDISGILLRQAQIEASIASGSEMPPFQMDVGDATKMQTSYSFHIGGDE